MRTKCYSRKVERKEGTLKIRVEGYRHILNNQGHTRIYDFLANTHGKG